MSKFYAVKKGRIPGIYTSWPTCQKQISGFSGALHKSFSNHLDALNYFYDGQVPEQELAKAKLPLQAQCKILPVINFPDITSMQTPKAPTSLLNDILDPLKTEGTEPFYYGTPKLPIVEKCNNYEKYDRSILDGSDFNIVIYIDGSKRPTVNHRGSGAYCRYNKKDFYLSCPFTDEIGHRYQIDPQHFAQLSSPTMEYLALAEVLCRFVKFQFPMTIHPSTGMKHVRILNPRIRLTFVADYDGVKNFTEGNWTAREDYIIKIKEAVLAVIKFLRERGIDVVILHTPGHKGMLGNELSDIRAKSQIAFDTIGQLVTEISEKAAREN